AGAVKGGLELWTPLRLSNALTKEGLQLGGVTLKGLATTALGELTTEGLQEIVDVQARKYADPGYSYFDPGASWYLGPGARRVIEAAVTGGVVGGVYGAPFHALEGRQERQAGQQAGGRRVYPPLLPPDSDLGGRAPPPIPGAQEYK